MYKWQRDVIITVHRAASHARSAREPESLLVDGNALSKVKKIIAVMSGKGGVGKSFVTSLLAVLMQRKGMKTAVLTEMYRSVNTENACA